MRRTNQWIERDGARGVPLHATDAQHVRLAGARAREKGTSQCPKRSPNRRWSPKRGSPAGLTKRATPPTAPHKPRRRGSRGGRNRKRPPARTGGEESPADDAEAASVSESELPELPERISENRPSAEAAERALVRKPQIGDSRPAPGRSPGPSPASDGDDAPAPARKRRRRGGRGRGAGGSHGRRLVPPTRARDDEPVELDEETLERRRGRERKGRPVGRYLMCVHVRPHATQIAVLEGRSLIEHYVSRPPDDISQIHGNIYLGQGAERPPGHGGRVRRHRHAQERSALPGRRAVRPRGRRREGRGDGSSRSCARVRRSSARSRRTRSAPRARA